VGSDECAVLEDLHQVRAQPHIDALAPGSRSSLYSTVTARRSARPCSCSVELPLLGSIIETAKGELKAEAGKLRNGD